MVQLKAEAIIPNVVNDPDAFLKFARAGLKRVSSQVRRDFKKTVSTWDKKPKFSVKRVIKDNLVIYSAGTDDEIYGYVNNGTKPHVIKPKPSNKKGLLFFKTGSIAKTTPNTLKSKSGGFAGSSKMVAARQVNHPGTKARRFDLIIAKRFNVKFQSEMNRALREYLQQNTRPAGRRA